MMYRHRRISFLTLFIILLTTSINLFAAEIALASWNIRILSDNSRDDAELEQIASIITRYDILAIQELRDEKVLQRLQRMLPDGWNYIVSDPVGRGVKERYAYLFNGELVESIGQAYIFPDPYDVFIREPFVAHFGIAGFDCTLVTMHTIYGDGIADRRGENSRMDDVLASIDTANGREDDLILLGDFNLPPDDPGWELEGYRNIVADWEMTTISDSSSYDNIWISTAAELDITISGHEIYRFDELRFANDDSYASRCCSDHRPIAMFFSAVGDNDIDGDYHTLASALAPDRENVPIPPSAYAHIDGTMIEIRDAVAQPTESEAVILRNLSDRTIPLAGWTLGDLNSPYAYEFPPDTVIDPRESIIMHHSILPFIINNSREQLFLKRPDGYTVSTWRN